METKICKKCGQEKPLESFVRNHKIKSGYANTCKECHNKMYPYNYPRKKAKVEFQPKLEDSVVKELEQTGLEKFSARLLIAELRRRGYRGKLQLVTIQEVCI